MSNWLHYPKDRSGWCIFKNWLTLWPIHSKSLSDSESDKNFLSAWYFACLLYSLVDKWPVLTAALTRGVHLHKAGCKKNLYISKYKNSPEFLNKTVQKILGLPLTTLPNHAPSHFKAYLNLTNTHKNNSIYFPKIILNCYITKLKSTFLDNVTLNWYAKINSLQLLDSTVQSRIKAACIYVRKLGQWTELRVVPNKVLILSTEAATARSARNNKQYGSDKMYTNLST